MKRSPYKYKTIDDVPPSVWNGISALLRRGQTSRAEQAFNHFVMKIKQRPGYEIFHLAQTLKARALRPFPRLP